MTTWKLCPLVSCVLWLGALAPSPARAEVACGGGPAVDLAVELDPADAQRQRHIEQRLAAELRARGVAVCPLVPGGMLAHMRVRATPPELGAAVVRIDNDGGAALERRLDFTGLPREARASAIASAADELLSSWLSTTPAAASGSAASPSAAAEPAVSASDAVTAPSDVGAGQAASTPHPRAAEELPRLQLGMGVGAARFDGGASAYSAELLGRWRPLSRLFATARAGGFGGSVADGAFGESSSAWFAGLDAGAELLEPAERFGLAARAGLALGRVERAMEGRVSTPVGEGSVRQSLGSSWEVVANAGAEASFRTGPWAVSLGATLLVPLTATSPDLPDLGGASFIVASDAGFGETFGGQLDLRVWFALDGAGPS